MKIIKHRAGLYTTNFAGHEYEIHYTPNAEYEKSKPWKLSFKWGGRTEPITRTRTKKEAIDQICYIAEITR